MSILDTPMTANDANATTVRGYLVALAAKVWVDGENFSGKRPFGNSGWQHEVYRALASAGVIESTLDAYGEIDITRDQERRADSLIAEALSDMAEETEELRAEAERLNTLVDEMSEDYGLTAGQQIRLEAARLLTQESNNVMPETNAEATSGLTVTILIRDMLRLAHAIETGETASVPTLTPGGRVRIAAGPDGVWVVAGLWTNTDDKASVSLVREDEWNRFAETPSAVTE